MWPIKLKWTRRRIRGGYANVHNPVLLFEFQANLRAAPTPYTLSKFDTFELSETALSLLVHLCLTSLVGSN